MVRYPALIAALIFATSVAAEAGQHPPKVHTSSSHSAPSSTHTASASTPRPVKTPGEPRPAATAPLRGRGFIPALGSINLSSDQRDRIRALVEQTRQANQSADPETRRQNIARMRAGIWQTLTPDQQAQFRNELTKPPPEPGDAPP